VNYIAKQVPRNGVFLDIGANIGSVAVAVAKKRPDIRIISIEALPRNYEYLTQNVKLNGLNNITTVNECCSETAGVTVRFYTHETMYGSSSLHNIHSNNYVELVTSTIDDQLRKLGIDQVDLIKIDTEGSEALVFRGAQHCFSAYHPPVLFEYNDEYENAVPGLKAGDAQIFLLDRGYVLYDFDQLASATPFKVARLNGSGEFLAVHVRETK
jgi:FkbM family methyltransferase